MTVIRRLGGAVLCRQREAEHRHRASLQQPSLLKAECTSVKLEHQSRPNHVLALLQLQSVDIMTVYHQSNI